MASPSRICVTGFTYIVTSAIDSWTIRRRLDAAIVLLQLQEEAAGR